MNWLWHTLVLCLIIIPATLLWAMGIFDVIFRRHDLSTGKRIGWLALILFVPIIGALIYACTLGSYFDKRRTGGPTPTEEVYAAGLPDDIEIERERYRVPPEV